jgi:riboflavin-specific deaminase-like protein
VRELVTGLGLHERSLSTPAGAPADAPAAGGRNRPYVLLNMVATLDGRATLEGRSGPLSDPADRALFHGLRSVVDAVMAGAGTVRAERYGPIVRDPDSRRTRREHGLREQPLACVVSASLGLPSDLPLLCDPDSHVAILTPSEASLPETAARVEYVRARRDDDDSLDLPAALAELHDRLHVRTLLCEGGPHLNADLLSAGLVDELFLSLSPLLAGDDPTEGGPSEGGPTGVGATGGGLAGGDPAGGKPPLRILAGGNPAGGKPPLRILAGAELASPRALELVSALERDSRLFLRYRVPPSPPAGPSPSAGVS